MNSSLTDEMAFGVRFNTRLPLEKVEDWLDGHCQEQWDVKLSGVVEDPNGRLWKRLEILFACADDRLRFRNHFAEPTTEQR